MRRTYSKTGICSAPDALTPHLDIEIGGDDKELIFYASLSHKLSLGSHLDYLDRWGGSAVRTPSYYYKYMSHASCGA